MCAAALAGCGSSGGYSDFYADLASIVGLNEADEAAQPTRADFDDIDAATIELAIGDAEPGFLFATTRNDNLVTYEATNRRTVSMRGAAVAATRGLGTNLLSVKHSPVDPIVSGAPLSAWPRSTPRAYTVAHFGEERTYRFICRWRFGEQRDVEIVEVQYVLLEVFETCQSPDAAISNTYWIDPAEPFVWQSLQWAGGGDQLTIRTIRAAAL